MTNAHGSRSRAVSRRPATPTRQLLPRQYSDPDIRVPGVAEPRNYYDEPPPRRRTRHASSSSRLNGRNSYRHVRSSSRPGRNYSHGPYETAEEEHYYYDPAIDRVPRGRMRGGGHRSRSRVSIDEGMSHIHLGSKIT